MVFDLINVYNQAELDEAVSQLILLLNTTTQPRFTTHFPKDLLVICDVLESLLDVLSEESLPSTHVVCVYVCVVLDTISFSYLCVQ